MLRIVKHTLCVLLMGTGMLHGQSVLQRAAQVPKKEPPKPGPLVSADKALYRTELGELIKKLRGAKSREERHTVMQEMRELREQYRHGKQTSPADSLRVLSPKAPMQNADKQKAKENLKVTESVKKADVTAGGIPSRPHIDTGKTIYHVPFSSSGNQIELGIVNSSMKRAANVKVEPSENPGWVRFGSAEQLVPSIAPDSEAVVSYTFSIAKSAPVRKEQILSFTVRTENGETWIKQIKIKIDAPERYELYQNYPNPFNPTTTISYDLSRTSVVTLTVYNILGEEVAKIVDGAIQDPGNQSASFNASNYPSGVYFYRLSARGGSGDKATDVEGNRGGTFTSVKKMMLVK